MKKLLIILALFIQCMAVAQQKNAIADTTFLRTKIKGLITGTLLGDALGGPIEFQGHQEIQASPRPPKLWIDTTDLMDAVELKAAAERMYFREYKYILPHVQPYGSWSENAAPGTVTDDSRHKMILMYMLRTAMQKNQWPVSEIHSAHAYLDWSKSKTIKTHSGYDTLCKQWLGESYKSINWILGNRKIGEAYPVERMWNALPTCYGQMALTPLAAIYPGQPQKAYLAAYNTAWFDIGFAKDMSAASVAGISVALTLDPTKMTNEELWKKVFDAMLTTDPYDYLKIPWCERQVQRWLNLSDVFVQQANGSPAKLFSLLDKEFMYTTKWEAQVPFLVVFSILKICNYDPLAAMQLSIEWGNDHDTYPQFLGAFVGALYGAEIFKADMRSTISKRLQLDYDENIDEWVNTLMKVQELGKKKILFKTN
ncbi:MAG: ADP-ribosylglycohydrolase family protein [Chitinophagaceae bacterium]|nr:ADP-ribosylglycohydrolase family protein [Chitinophagaceae bacterium]